MCVAFVAYRAHPDWPLVVMGNRDEHFERPSAPAAFWQDAPEVFAGRDLQAGGTWLGVSRAGRWALVTNYRDAAAFGQQGRSRGALVAGFLTSSQAPAAWVEALLAEQAAYNTFNVLVGDAHQSVYHGDRALCPVALSPGVYGLSNALLDTPWPKVQVGKARLAARLASSGAVDLDALTELLLDRAPFDEALLPDTGVGPDWERRLSPLFVYDPERSYGTRVTTAFAVSSQGTLSFLERRWGPQGEELGQTRVAFEARGWGGR